METEPLNAVCFILMVVVTCCIIKLLHMVRNMRIPWNQGAVTQPNRTIHDQNVLGTARESTLRRGRVVESTEQHGNTATGGVTARRRHPQEHDERFRNKVRQL